MGSTRYFLVPVPSVLWKRSTGTAVPVLLFFNFEAVLGTFAKSSVKKNHKKVKLAQLHLPQLLPSRQAQQQKDSFPTAKDILKPKRSLSFRRPFPNAFVFERQFRVKFFQ